MMGAAVMLALAIGLRPADAAGIEQFNARVADYMRIRQNIVRDLPSERPFVDPREMMLRRTRLRAMIRAARPGARAGDVITPDAAREFRRIAAATLRASPLSPRRLHEAFNADRGPGAKRPAVNGQYDWNLGAWMWPALLQKLPALPPELEYRIVDDDLVLVDVGASLVVDILEHALELDEE